MVYMVGPTTNVKLQFGNPYAVADPYAVTPLGGSLYNVYFRVPRLATTVRSPDLPGRLANPSAGHVHGVQLPQHKRLLVREPHAANIAFDDVASCSV